MSRIVAIAALLALSACGFQLQGAGSLPPDMQRTFIDATDEHSLFYRQLRRELIAGGAELVDTRSEATAVIRISFDSTGQRVLSVSARNVPTEYEVFYTIEYGVSYNDRVLLETQDLTLTRDYTWDPNLVLGKAQEEQVLREAIVADLVRIILKQISTQ